MKLFELFTNKLIANKIVAKEVTIIDAFFIDIPIQRSKRRENKIPKSFMDNPNKLSQKDCDARWVKKNNKNEYGYKEQYIKCFKAYFNWNR